MLNNLKSFHPISLLIYGLLTLFFMISPFYVGVANGHELFLEPYLYVTFIFTAVLLLASGVWLYQRSDKLNRLDPAPLLVWLLPVCFILALTHAVAVQDAIHSIQIHVFQAALFIVGYYLSTTREGTKPFVYILMISGYVLIFTTLSEWLGTNFIANSVVYSIGDYRIFSSLRYPNTYAALMIAFFFVSSYMAVASRHRRFALPGAFLTVPALLSLILTYSRGGYVIFVLLFILFLFMMPLIRQVLFLVFSIFSMAITAIIYPFISQIGIGQQSEFSPVLYGTGWLIIIVASALPVLTTMYVSPRIRTRLDTKFSSLSVRKYTRVLIPLTSILLIVVAVIAISSDSVSRLLPEQLQNRLGDLNFRQHSVLERITFYKDAMKIVEDYPLTGAGGGAWNTLYQEYQNNPYVTKKPHNLLLRHTAETGIIGLGVLLALLILVYYRFIRYAASDENYSQRFVFFLFATSILIHSLIDFNMEFLYISGLVYLSLGIMASRVFPASTETSSKRRNHRQPFSLLRMARISVLGFVAVVLIIVSGRSLYAHHLYKESVEGLNTRVTAEEAVNNLNTALKLQPNHPHYLTGMIGILHAIYRVDSDPIYLQYAETFLERLKKANTNYIASPEFEIEHFRLLKDLDGMADASLYWLNKFPWKQSLYDETIPLLYNLGQQQLNLGQNTTRWDELLQLYEVMLERIERIESLPEEQMPGLDFYISEQIVYLVGDVLLARNQSEKALDVIVHHYSMINMDSPRNIVRIYLAAHKHLGTLDEGLYQQFTEQYPDEIFIIDSLVNRTTL